MTQTDVEEVEITVTRWNIFTGVTLFVSEAGWTAAAVFSRASLESLRGWLRSAGIEVVVTHARFSRRLERVRRPLDSY